MNIVRELIDQEGVGRLPRSRTGLVAFLLTTAGVFLGCTVDQAFLILAAAGIFGPNLLREFNILRDQDELQREVSRRAAMHAHLFGGLLTLAVVIAQEWGSTDFDDNSYSAIVLLMAFLIPYFCSYLTSFWGPRKSAQRILLSFGLFWLLFNILGHLRNPLAMVMQSLTALPFIALAFSCHRFPRVTGALLLACSVAAFILFNLWQAFLSAEKFPAMAVLLLFWLPLFYSGIMLLGGRHGQAED